MMPVAQRVLGESHRLTLKLRRIYAQALYRDPGATLDDLREAVTTFEDVERTARRVFGGQHPFTVDTERPLRLSRATLRAREDAEPTSRRRSSAAVSNRGDQAGAAADPNAELKAEIAALEAQLTEKRHELSRRTAAQDQAPPPPTGSFSIGTSSPPARGRAGRRIVRARRPPRAARICCVESGVRGGGGKLAGAWIATHGGVLDARRPDRERRAALGNRRRVDDLAHAVLAPRLLELQPRVRRVRDDVPADGLRRVLREATCRRDSTLIDTTRRGRGSLRDT